MANEKDEKIGIIYGKHADFLAWMMTQDGPWKDFLAKAKPPKTEFFWPSKPQLPSMILKSSLSDQDVNYIPLETAMAREHLLLEYADAVKKVAMDMVDAGVKADLPAYEQAAKQQGINWCIKLLQRIAEEHDDKAAKMIGYNVRSRAGNELREAIAMIRKEEQGMWADG